MNLRNITWPFQRLVSTSLILLIWLGFSAAAKAQDYRNPQVQLGWEVVLGSQLQLVALPRKAAPSLPRWVAHGPETDSRESLHHSPSESVLRERMKPVLDRALEIVNDYLPNSFAHDFQLWIFREIPYAAKTVDPHLILSARLLQPDDWGTLPFVLAHEIHHLALMKAGWNHSGVSPRKNLLAGLLTEGTATWLSAGSRLFPELDRILQDPQQLEASFGRVAQALGRIDQDFRGNEDDLYQHNKWGYYVGCWMIQQIEGQFGREAWLKLLEMGLEEATQELIRVYLLTDPPPQYRF
jgi:hypothetical protein